MKNIEPQSTDTELSRETNLRVFSAAKLFAEEILFPILETYHKFKRQSDFGHENLDNVKLFGEELKDIERFNGLKGMNDTVSSLIVAISSTVRLKQNRDEIAQLDEVKNNVESIKSLFYYHREKFFKNIFSSTSIIEVLDREYFEKVKKLIETCYINTEMLMTRNNLLFRDSREDYLTDEEIMETIKREYTEG